VIVPVAEPNLCSSVPLVPEGGTKATLDRIMQAYGLMVNATPDEEQAARRAVERYLADKVGNETSLAVQGLRYLRTRGSRRSPPRRRKPRSASLDAPISSNPFR